MPHPSPAGNTLQGWCASVQPAVFREIGELLPCEQGARLLISLMS